MDPGRPNGTPVMPVGAQPFVRGHMRKKSTNSATDRGSGRPGGPKVGDFRAEIPIFWPQKKRTLFNSDHVLATTGQSCQKKKVPFSQMNISLLANFGIFFGKKRIFGPFSAFRQNVKTAVSP